MDIRDLLRLPRRLTARQVIVYLRHLPNDSALARRGVAMDVAPSQDFRGLSELVNQLRILDYHFVCANTQKKEDLPKKPRLIELPL